MLEDKDRIFTNLYGLHDPGLGGGQSSAAPGTATKDILVVRARLAIIKTKASGLRGRGVGFSTGLKWSFMPKEVREGRPHYLVVNADESEPGTCKDREILRHDPHLSSRVAWSAASPWARTPVYIYVRGEYILEREWLEAAVKEAYEAKLIGKDNIHGWAVRLYVITAQGPTSAARRRRFWNAWRARRASRAEAAFPGQHGPLRLPDDSQQRGIDRGGADNPAARGRLGRRVRPPQQPGTKLFCVSGHVNKAVQCGRGNVDFLPPTDRASLRRRARRLGQS